MRKRIVFFNTMALGALLCSCLQLHAKIVNKTLEDKLEKAKTEISPPMKVGGYEVKYSLLGTFLDEKGSKKKFYLIQLPCRRQDSDNQCGTYAFENCKILSLKNLNLAKVVKNLNSDEQKKKILAIKRCLKVPKYAKKWKKDHEKEKKTKYNFKIVDLNNTGWSVTIPGVYMILTKGSVSHWIAVRLEKTNNGDIAILVADSFYSIEHTRHLDSSGFVKSLIKALGYKGVEYLPYTLPIDEDGFLILQ